MNSWNQIWEIDAMVVGKNYGDREKRGERKEPERNFQAESQGI